MKLIHSEKYIKNRLLITFSGKLCTGLLATPFSVLFSLETITIKTWKSIVHDMITVTEYHYIKTL